VFVARSGAVRTVQGGLEADELRRAMTELADLFGVGRFTVYRAQQRHRAATRV